MYICMLQAALAMFVVHMPHGFKKRAWLWLDSILRVLICQTRIMQDRNEPVLISGVKAGNLVLEVVLYTVNDVPLLHVDEHLSANAPDWSVQQQVF